MARKAHIIARNVPNEESFFNALMEAIGSREAQDEDVPDCMDRFDMIEARLTRIERVLSGLKLR